MDYLKRNSKNIIIVILSILFIGACITIFYLLNNKRIETTKEITGTVIIADTEYLIIESNKENYLISNIKGSYDVGDKVKFKFLTSKLDSDKSPKEIIINDEELIEKNINEESNNKDNKVPNKDNNTTNDKENNNVTNSSNQNNTTTKPNNNPTINEKVEDADTTVLNYMNDLEMEMNKPGIGETVKNGFITVIDFLFYNGTIKGYKFSELTNSAKLKVISVALYLDSKIDKYFPGYKESITKTTKKIYTSVKENAITLYLNITNEVCSTNSEICTSAKDGFQSLKKNFGLTFDLIKEIAGDGITNLKNWYEIWSGK